jgi:hypothetical protein
MNLILITFIEIIYVIYMLRYFKTKYSLSLYEVGIRNMFTNHSLKNYVSHNINNTSIPDHHICPFGRDASLIIGLYLLLRIYYLKNNNNWNWIINKTIVILILLISLVNINAVIYLLPFYITELIILYNSI